MYRVEGTNKVKKEVDDGLMKFCAKRILSTTKGTVHIKKMLLQARNARDGREGVASRTVFHDRVV